MTFVVLFDVINLVRMTFVVGTREASTYGAHKITRTAPIYVTYSFRPLGFVFFMHFYPGTMTTHAESINSDLQRGLDIRLRHTQR